MAARGQIVKVSGQVGDHVLISVPMVGFPPGFTLRPGDKVFLTHGENGPEVRPLTGADVVDDAGGTERAALRGPGGNEYVVQPATLRVDSGEGNRHVVFTVENDELPNQVVSIRRTD